MTLPRLPGIIPADGSAAISDTQVQTHTPKHARAYKYTKPHALQFARIQPYKKYAYIHSRKLPQPRYKPKTVIYYPMYVCVWARMHVCVPDKGGGGEGEGGGEEESFILNSHKSCRRKMSKCAG